MFLLDHFINHIILFKRNIINIVTNARTVFEVIMELWTPPEKLALTDICIMNKSYENCQCVT